MAEVQPILLYESPTSSNCQRVKVVLEEKKLPYQTVRIDLKKGDQKRPDFLKLNPYGKVPVIVDGDTVVYESCIINEYLNDKYPEPPLMPENPAQRAKIRILTGYGVNHLFTTHRALRDEMSKAENEREPTAISKARKDLQILLLRFEQEMGDQAYLAGNSVSLLDTNFVARFVQWERFGVLPDPSLPRLGAWLNRMKQRPSVKVIPQVLPPA
ncbi:MAG: glutathione S-transferase family protein [Gammaproteobacteria bacterium]